MNCVAARRSWSPPSQEGQYCTKNCVGAAAEEVLGSTVVVAVALEAVAVVVAGALEAMASGD